MTGSMRVLLALTVAVGLSACAEKPQEASAGAKASQPAWRGADNPYVVDGWKPGDQGSWDDQIRRRAQGQNEYVRIGGAS